MKIQDSIQNSGNTFGFQKDAVKYYREEQWLKKIDLVTDRLQISDFREFSSNGYKNKN